MYGALKLDREYVLSRISEEDIMSYYLGVPVQVGKYIVSPLRQDKAPTCAFTYDRRGVLKFKDFAGHFHGDCFNVVEHIYSCGFADALKIIAQDFNLRGKTSVPERVEKLAISKQQAEKVQKAISIKRQRWQEVDKAFWSSFGIKSTTLKHFGVDSVSHAWVRDVMVYSNDPSSYGYNPQDPCYSYTYNTTGSRKLYFPFRDNMRFLTNDADYLQGYDQLPKSGKLLIVTKSLKDVMLLYQYGIAAVAPAAESMGLTASQYEELSKRFTTLYSLYDFDYAGIKGARKMRQLYGIKPLFLTNGRFNSVNYLAKDVSDFFKLHGKQLFEEFISFHISLYERYHIAPSVDQTSQP